MSGAEEQAQKEEAPQPAAPDFETYKAGRREGKVAHYVPEPADNRSVLEQIAELSWTNPKAYEQIIEELVEKNGDDWVKKLRYDWSVNARPKQMIPEPRDKWRAWTILAGRGFGKTRTGAETVKMYVDNGWAKRIALVGATAADVNNVMVGGEALHIDTPIPTPDGWRTMADINVGDRVFSEHGEPVDVLWVSEVAEDRPCYRVVFSDGSSLIADENHKWYSETRKYRRIKDKGVKARKDTLRTVFTTKELMETLVLHRNHKGVMYNHSIPLTKPLNYGASADALPVDPYVLGYWLGDGSSRRAEITTMDDDVIAAMSEKGYTTRVQPHSVKSESKASVYSILGLGAELRKLGVLKNKHIPECYQQAEAHERIELLRGLMDSDGYCGTNGRCYFSNTSLTLLRDVEELLSGLGLKYRSHVHTNGKLRNGSVNPCFEVGFAAPFEVFRIRRKKDRQKLEAHPKAFYRSVVDVVPMESVPVKCIAVDSETHLYLAGRQCIPTHNSGLMNIYPEKERPRWIGTHRKLIWYNKDGTERAIADCFSAEEPERLRGPQFDFAWVDELAAWRYQYAWDMLMFGLRLGDNPQVVVTTTPKPVPILMDLLKLPTTWTTIGSTYENRANLAKAFFGEIITKYEGTTLGRQELMAEIVEEIPNAMWNYENLDRNRIEFDKLGELPEFLMVVAAIDPATTTRTSSAETGMCVAAYGEDDHFYILHLDAVKESPEQWARRAIKLYNDYNCDKLIAEVNNGGDLVEAVIRAANPNQKVHPVHASRGKVTRAEPVAALYEQNRVHHVGRFADGENQMTTFNPIENPYGYKDMVDALVWAMTYLIDQTQGKSPYRPLVGGTRSKLQNYNKIFPYSKEY